MFGISGFDIGNMLSKAAPAINRIFVIGRVLQLTGNALNQVLETLRGFRWLTS
jgi:hypothetical protein